MLVYITSRHASYKHTNHFLSRETAGDVVRNTQSAGVLNQALMELGATVCTPTSPSCTACPVASHCVALHRAHHSPTQTQHAPNVPRTQAHYTHTQAQQTQPTQEEQHAAQHAQAQNTQHNAACQFCGGTEEFGSAGPVTRFPSKVKKADPRKETILVYSTGIGLLIKSQNPHLFQ